MLPLLATAQLKSSDKQARGAVPFRFAVANKAIPAGECIVQLSPAGEKTLIIWNEGARPGPFVRGAMDETKQAAGGCALVVNRYGDQHFPAGIKLKGSTITYRMPETKAEAEMRAQNAPAAEEISFAALK
jgi:hypothetical protein